MQQSQSFDSPWLSSTNSTTGSGWGKPSISTTNAWNKTVEPSSVTNTNTSWGKKQWDQAPGNRGSWDTGKQSSSPTPSAWDQGSSTASSSTSSNWVDKGTSNWGSTTGDIDSKQPQQWNEEKPKSVWPQAKSLPTTPNRNGSTSPSSVNRLPRPKSATPPVVEHLDEIVSNPDSGWGKVQVRQDVQWDVEIKANPIEPSNQWQNDKGTAIWETCKTEVAFTQQPPVQNITRPQVAQRSNSWTPQQHKVMDDKSGAGSNMWGGINSGSSSSNSSGNNNNNSVGRTISSSTTPAWGSAIGQSTNTTNNWNQQPPPPPPTALQQQPPPPPLPNISVWDRDRERTGAAKVETGNWTESQPNSNWGNQKQGEIDNGTALWQQQQQNDGNWGQSTIVNKDWISQQDTAPPPVASSHGNPLDKLLERGYSKESAQNALQLNHFDVQAALSDLASSTSNSRANISSSSLQQELQRLVDNEILPAAVLQITPDDFMLKQIQTIVNLHQFLEKCQNQKRMYSSMQISEQSQMNIRHLENKIKDARRQIQDTTTTINYLVKLKTSNSTNAPAKNNQQQPGLSNLFSRMAIPQQTQPATTYNQQSKLSMWTDSKESAQGGISIMPNAWSTTETDQKDQQARAVIHEFVPGKPWNGLNNVEDDDHATPASVFHPFKINVESTLQSSTPGFSTAPPQQLSSFNRSQSWSGFDSNNWEDNRFNVRIKNVHHPHLQDASSLKTYAMHYGLQPPIVVLAEKNSFLAKFQSFEDAERYIRHLNSNFGLIAQMAFENKMTDMPHSRDEGWSSGGSSGTAVRGGWNSGNNNMVGIGGNWGGVHENF